MNENRPTPAAQTRAPITTKGVVGGGIAACAAACLALAVAGIKPDEGKWNIAKRDFAQGIVTECYGHTGPDVKLGQRRTDAQCEAELSADVDREMKGVAACVPGVATRPTIWAAYTRMAHNTGVPAFCGSTTARLSNAGQWRAACDAMLAWDKAVVRGVKVEVPGLLARRQRERAQCLMGVAA